MFRFVFRRQSARKYSSLSAATSPVVESLERRQMLAANPLTGLPDLSFTPDEVVEVEFGGKKVQAVGGEYIVGLKRPEPTRDGSGDIIDFNTKYNFSANAKQGLRDKLSKAAVDLGFKLGSGLTFGGYLGVEHTFLVRVGKDLPFDKLQKALSKLDGFEYVEPNGVVRGASVPHVNDPRFAEQYALHLTKTGSTNKDNPEAWDFTSGHNGTVVAVLDTGMNGNHQDLSANRWVNPSEILGDGIDNDGNGKVDDKYGLDAVNGDNDPSDDNGHGTAVAGVIGARGNNSVGVAGVAHSVKIMPVKVLNHLNGGTDASISRGIQYVNSTRDAGVNVRVINASLGGPGPLSATQQAIFDADERDLLFVCAAGNNG